MGLFGSLFSMQPRLAEPSFVNPITTELHSHLIPGIDDGVRTIEESLIVLREMAELGYKKVITTPHIMGDFYKNGPENILPLLDKLRNALVKENIKLELEAAAEYMVDDSLELKIKNKNLLSFGQNYVLIELPFTDSPANLKQVLFDLQVNGYRPVLAHPERYGYLAMNKDKFEELFETGIHFQLNLFSLVGYYSKQIQKTAEWMISKKMVHMVGSDTHGPRHLDVLNMALKSYNYQKVCHLPLLNNKL